MQPKDTRMQTLFLQKLNLTWLKELKPRLMKYPAQPNHQLKEKKQ